MNWGKLILAVATVISIIVDGQSKGKNGKA